MGRLCRSGVIASLGSLLGWPFERLWSLEHSCSRAWKQLVEKKAGIHHLHWASFKACKRLDRGFTGQLGQIEALNLRGDTVQLAFELY
jgi:hypothetical protein